MLTIRHGDCRTVLAEMPAQSVHCCVTSPPYFGLRDYGTAKWDGGDAACRHKPDAEWIASQINGSSGLDGGFDRQAAAATKRWLRPDGSCRCGATRIDSQIGLEATPDAYVAELVAVFREVRRVLRDDGTLWLNLGDSYGAVGGDTHSGFNARYSGTGLDGGKQAATGKNARAAGAREVNTDLRPKNLIGIPWRVAFALQADGWYLRQDIIWSKPNPMPESVTDRCTKAHEYIFLMSKNARYYYDAAAIAEPANSLGRQHTSGIQPPKVLALKANGHHGVGGDLSINYERETRNRRSVWEVASQPFAEAHFATFPPDLIEPCILAGCPKGGTVLDPFGGAGTTGMVADRLQRSAVLIELNPAYAGMAENRLRDDGGMFAEIAT